MRMVGSGHQQARWEPPRDVAAIAEDRDDNVWVSVDVGSSARKLFRIRDLRVQEEFAPDRMPLVRRIAADPTGGIWLGFEDGNLGHYQNGKLEIFPLPNGSVPHRGSHRTLTNAEIGYLGLTIDADGSAWVSTWSGLVRWKNREMKTLTSKNGLPCDAIVSAIRDDQATLWLYTKCGFVAVTDAELEQWWQQPDRIVDVRVLDVFDGAVLPAGPRRFQPAVSKSPDGRLWFVNGGVLQMIDPGGLRKNRIPPPVYVEGVRADRQDYAIDGLVRLPARSRDIEISYTALSFSAPQKVRFRYKLEGRDQEWQDAGQRRQVFYSDLPPGHVPIPCDGCQQRRGVERDRRVIDFSIAPAYYQTTWFRAALLVAVLALLWAVYQLRLRQLAHRLRRAAPRAGQRTDAHRARAARHAAAKLPWRHVSLSSGCQRAPRSAVGRQSSDWTRHSSMAPTRSGRDGMPCRVCALPRWSRTTWPSRSARWAKSSRPLRATTRTAEPQPLMSPSTARREPSARSFATISTGSPARRCATPSGTPALVGLKWRSGTMTASFTCASVTMAKASIAGVLDAHRAGHFGLPGMRERAEQIGGHLEVWSEAGMGTEVALTIPGATVYATPRTRRPFWSFAGRRQGAFMSASSDPIRILTVDDHPLLRAGIEALVSSQPDMLVVAECSNGRDAIQQFRKHRPDVTLMDLQMPEMSGTDAIIAIRAEFPDARIIVLTTYAGDVQALRALQAGARGYLLKDAVQEELLDTIRAVHAGKKTLSPTISRGIAEHATDDALTKSEIDVLRLIAEGKANKQIADQLSIAEETVKSRVKNILSKLGADDRTHAAMIGLKRGIIQLQGVRCVTRTSDVFHSLRASSHSSTSVR